MTPLKRTDVKLLRQAAKEGGAHMGLHAFAQQKRMRDACFVVHGVPDGKGWGRLLITDAGKEALAAHDKENVK